MPGLTLTIAPEYGYVAAVAVASTFVSTWHGIKVGMARKEANVPYPNAYADAVSAAADIKKYKFNCWQRSHANFLENYPTFLSTLFLAGVQYPEYAAGCGAVYLVGRVLYAYGYAGAKPEGKGRYNGAFFHFAQWALLGMAGKVAYNLLQ